MAIYHLSVKAISRSAGRSATAAAAYRAGEEITDARTGQVHDYTRKGGVEHTEIVMPTGAGWQPSRSELWNTAEQAEKRKDACVAREFEVALPAELLPAERRRLMADFARDLADREGCAVDIAIHAPGRGGDHRNHHAHILRTTRKAGATGLGEKLDTEKAGRRRKDDLESVRKRWAEFANRALERAGLDTRIDHRTLEAQGQDRAPGQHQGPALTGMARRGETGQVTKRRAEEAEDRRFAAREVGRIEAELTTLDAASKAPPVERPAPDPLAGFRARIERAEADGGGLALNVAKAQLAVAQEFQADGKDPRHHGAEIAQKGQDLAFAGLRRQIQTEPERPPGRERPGLAVSSSRFRVPGKDLADSGPASLSFPLASNQAPPETALKATQSHAENHPLGSGGGAQKQASERLVDAVRPLSVAAVAVDLGKIDRTAPIEQQKRAFLEIANGLANWRLQKASRASERAQERYWRRYRQLGDAQKARRQATPSGLLGVFRQKTYAAADATYQRASVLHSQASAFMDKLAAAAREDAVKQWTWGRLAQAAPDLTERVKAHREAERAAESQARQAAQKNRQQGRTGPRRGR